MRGVEGEEMEEGVRERKGIAIYQISEEHD